MNTLDIPVSNPKTGDLRIDYPGFDWNKIFRGDSALFLSFFRSPGKWQTENTIANRQGTFASKNRRNDYSNPDGKVTLVNESRGHMEKQITEGFWVSAAKGIDTLSKARGLLHGAANLGQGGGREIGSILRSEVNRRAKQEIRREKVTPKRQGNNKDDDTQSNDATNSSNQGAHSVTFDYHYNDVANPANNDNSNINVNSSPEAEQKIADFEQKCKTAQQSINQMRNNTNSSSSQPVSQKQSKPSVANKPLRPQSVGQNKVDQSEITTKPSSKPPIKRPLWTIEKGWHYVGDDGNEISPELAPQQQATDSSSQPVSQKQSKPSDYSVQTTPQQQRLEAQKTRRQGMGDMKLRTKNNKLIQLAETDQISLVGVLSFLGKLMEGSQRKQDNPYHISRSLSRAKERDYDVEAEANINSQPSYYTGYGNPEGSKFHRDSDGELDSEYWADRDRYYTDNVGSNEYAIRKKYNPISAPDGYVLKTGNERRKEDIENQKEYDKYLSRRDARSMQKELKNALLKKHGVKLMSDRKVAEQAEYSFVEVDALLERIGDRKSICEAGL